MNHLLTWNGKFWSYMAQEVGPPKVVKNITKPKAYPSIWLPHFLSFFANNGKLAKFEDEIIVWIDKSLTLSLPRVTSLILLCLTPVDFTLSNARRFYSSKGDPLGVKGLKKLSPLTLSLPRVTLLILLCLMPDDFTLSNTRWFYSV